jgi:hypothetical protein
MAGFAKTMPFILIRGFDTRRKQYRGNYARRLDPLAVPCLSTSVLGIGGNAMTASNLCFKAAMLLLLGGMIWGLQMAIADNHTAYPAHAHLNLLGFVALFLFGIFYRLNPNIEANKLAIPQVWIWIVSTIVLSIGVGLAHTGHKVGDPIAAVGSLIVFADTVLFTWLVFQAPSA